MGYKIEINWVIKLKSEQLEQLCRDLANNPQPPVKEVHYYFEKKDERIYPIGIPIELVDDDWNVIAEVSITELTISPGNTKGFYCVVALPSIERKSLYSRYI
jgi:hypothetical protein